jgi:multidrug efflux pump subunit AcrB
MFERLVAYFAKRHILSNLVFLTCILGGVFSWFNTNKEELPSITFDTVRVSVVYRGAPAQDVEYFVTKPIEERLRGLDGVFRITSSSSVGQASISVELERNYPQFNEAILEIRNAVLEVELPDEVIDEPTVRVFKTSKKAVLDIALYHIDKPLLDVPSRAELQKYAFALENQLNDLPEVNSVTRRGYLQEEIQIRLKPEEMGKRKIPFNTVIGEIRNNNVRSPAGTLESPDKPKVTLISELDTPDKIKAVAVQGGFQGQVVRLSEVAEVERGYDESEPIHKVNGREAIMFNVVKNSSVGILETLDAVTALTKRFSRSSLKDSPIQLVLLDDESVDVRNRLNLIGVNGSIGFILILIILFIFLDWRSGFWVAMGIPFTLCFTMIVGKYLGYTINGTTLSAVIIVMGIVVDDAIIVAENITRFAQRGLPRAEAVVKGTSYVLVPIFASIITTCFAFLPLMFFEGHFGAFIEFIPPIICLMLLASFVESIFILPGHMGIQSKKGANDKTSTGHWFDRVEQVYSAFLRRIIPIRSIVVLAFVGLMFLSWKLVSEEMKFVMFPNEETRDIVLTGETVQVSNRYDTARKVQEIEDIIIPYIGKEVIGFRTEIARSRRGGAAAENSFRTIVEIVTKEQRAKSADAIVEEIQQRLDNLSGFKNLRFAKTRWGYESGSPIELFVQQNDNALRGRITSELVLELEKHPSLTNVSIDQAYTVPEYQVDINREMIKRLSIDPRDLVSTFRAALEGTVLFEYSNGDEDIQVRLTTVDDAKRDIKSVLQIPVENRNNYLVTLDSLVTVSEVVSPSSISRRDLKRTSVIDADIVKDSGRTPLEIAQDLETNVFPAMQTKYPTTSLSFGGEIRDTRESKSDFMNAVVMVLILVYAILAVLFNSLFQPFIIMLAIPFGLVGVILAFYLHGKLVFGFYACVGALGLAGVVINDAIIMLVTLNRTFQNSQPAADSFNQIAAIGSTRLRAVLLTTITTVCGVLPTAYGFAGYDATLSEMMLALTWGMIFGTLITLLLIPCLYSYGKSFYYRFQSSEVGV